MLRVISVSSRLVRGFVCAGVTIVLSVFAAGTTHAQSALEPAGTGTEADPYLVSSLSNLVWMGDNVGSSSGVYFKVQNDIDASDTAGWNSGSGFAPIGSVGAPFMGIFDGNGMVISNLTVNRPSQEYVGLFGYLQNCGIIKHLRLRGGAITGTNLVGSLVGSNIGKLTDCYSTMPVVGTGSYVGGLAGWNNGAMNDCSAEGSVAGTTQVGGLVGRNNGTLSDCHTTGGATGREYVGGLIGYVNSGAVVTRCYSTGPVTGTFRATGNLLGQNSGTVSNCYASGSTAGSNEVGGLIGYHVPGAVLSRCYATGVSSGTNYVGGLLGANDGLVTNCYATGSVTGKDTIGGLVGYNGGAVRTSYSIGPVAGNTSIGGLMGYSDGGSSVSNCYWDTNTSGQATSPRGTGKSTAEMKQRATFAGWDFRTVWRIGNNVTYPLLRGRMADCDFDGDGKSDYGCYDAAGIPGVVQPGQWYFMKSTAGFDNSVRFGYAGTVSVVGDFDGDGIADFGCYDAAGIPGLVSPGQWYFMKSSEGFDNSVTFGYAGTVPVVGDFDGDGTTDFGCYDATGIPGLVSPGQWYFMKSSEGFDNSVTFGYAGTVPIVGDFDGDGIDDYGCYDAAGIPGVVQPGQWYFMKSTGGFDNSVRFGYAGTVPVVGDFDGDGTADYGCYDAAGVPGVVLPGQWYFMKSTGGFDNSVRFGYAGTVPVVGDYDGDGTDDFGCYDAAGIPGVVDPGSWYFMKSTDGFSTETFGYAGTVPVGGLSVE